VALPREGCPPLEQRSPLLRAIHRALETDVQLFAREEMEKDRQLRGAERNEVDARVRSALEERFERSVSEDRQLVQVIEGATGSFVGDAHATPISSYNRR
jgi:hypothetical protein